MTTEGTQAILADAWGRIPSSRGVRGVLGTFTRQRIERAIGLAAGFGCLVLGAQAFLAAIGSAVESQAWHVALLVATFGPLLLMLAACAVGSGIRVFAGLFAIVFPVVLLVWPLATGGGAGAGDETEPWIWYLLNVATVAAVLAFPLLLQVVWTISIPLLYGVVVLVQLGFAPGYWLPVAGDVSFALILGGILLTLAWLFRSIAANVDRERARAVQSYADAAAADAVERERVAMAALMHDSVLAALIAAERATTDRERSLAAAMAAEALAGLADPEQDAPAPRDEPVDAPALADAIEAGARDVGIELVATRSLEAGAHVPGSVASALALAATQAVANAVQHADGLGLQVQVEVTATPSRVRVDVRDSGGGFDVDDFPDDRLGIRGSIVARVAAIGGTTDIASDEHGTRVRMEWMEGAP